MQHNASMLSKRELQVRLLGAGSVTQFQADSRRWHWRWRPRRQQSIANAHVLWLALVSSVGERLARSALTWWAQSGPAPVTSFAQGNSQAGAAQERWMDWKTEQHPEQQAGQLGPVDMQATMANHPGAQSPHPPVQSAHLWQRVGVLCRWGYDVVDWSVQFSSLRACADKESPVATAHALASSDRWH
jgi:hypothetical protein